MLQKLVNFVKYNNAFSIGFAVVFLSVSGAMAASPDLRESVIGEETSVRSVDNSYLISTNLDSFNPTIQITGITEDIDFYYVNYSMNTIDLVDYIWQPTDKVDSMKVEKKSIEGKDLGIYVSRQLKELSDAQISRLRETQNIEKRNGMTQKVVATAYSGLIGRFLDPKEEKFPGYVPVVIPKEPESTAVVSTQNQNDSSQAVQDNQPLSQTTLDSSLDNVPPGITIIGNNPFVINVGDTYIDPGVLILDNKDIGLVPVIAVDGSNVKSISIDTSVSGHHTIIYTAKDSAGNSSNVVREVIVMNRVIETQSGTTTPETPPPSDTSTTTNNTSTNSPPPSGEGTISTSTTLTP